VFGVETEILATLFVVALVAGTVDAIAGGGGLLTVPALLLAGVDPVTAIGTNKIQSVAGTASSTLAYARRGLIHWPSAWPVALAAGLGSVGGALCVRLLRPELLSALVPVLLVAVAIYFVTAKRMGDEDVHHRMPPSAFALTAAPLVGFYDGVFGPGAGAFYVVAFVTLLGYGALKATAHTKLANVSSNVGSLSVFIVSGAVSWPIGLAMACGSMIGAQIGSRLAMRVGSRLIRPLLVVICCAMAIRLLSDPDNPLRHAVSGLLS
jgi:hypothetical protein